MPELNSDRHQLTVIVFTDIMGYTALMGSDEAFAMEVLGKNRTIHKTCLANFDGELLKEMGDGNLLRFSSAIQAVRCDNRQ